MKPKKIALFVLMFLLVVPSVGFAADSNTVDLSAYEGLFNELSHETIEEIMYEDNDKVRVIVELEEKPVMDQFSTQGLLYQEANEQQRANIEESLLSDQNELIRTIEDRSISLEVEHQFTTVFNGFSGDVTYTELETLKSLENVKSVYIANVYERPAEEIEMVTSNEMVEASKTWSEYGYKGEGMVVAVIDSGLDPSHPDMRLSEDTDPALTENIVNNTIQLQKEQGYNMHGKYFTEKVPYGYNYYNKNTEILDLGPAASEHGMHVSGSVAANAEDTSVGIKGVAPEAQLLAMKVFGNYTEETTTSGDIYIKAIDDAIKLQADVINMSLGAPAQFVNEDDPEQQAVKRAVDNGVMVSVSAGNSQAMTGGFYPRADHPDYGVVGSPGISYDTIQVASIENTNIQLEEFIADIGGTDYSIAYKKADAPDALDVFNSEMDVVYVEDGQADKYVGKDVEGKVVFVVRTGSFFYAQIQVQAEIAGAAGVIVRGFEGHGDYVNMAVNDPIIPMVSLSIADGNMLEEKVIENGGEMKVTFTGERLEVINNAGGEMSTFTSWGLTPNLDFKPEITAPGGQIYSTLQNGKYGVNSGTSMAAPHVSGGSALVMEYIDDKFKTEGRDRVYLAKNMLMNTAQVVYTEEDLPYSPRRQGSGIMQLHKALSTPVVVVEEETEEAKVALKEVRGNVASFELTATNYSDESVTYAVYSNVQTDAPAFAGVMYSLMEPLALPGAEISMYGDVTDSVYGTTVTVPARDSVSFDVEIDLRDVDEDIVEIFENGYWFEGFVQLVDVNGEDGVPTLSVPYVGFKGDWNDAPILDSLMYEDDSYAVYGVGGMVGQSIYGLYYLGVHPLNQEYTPIAFSPNNDGEYDDITPYLSFVRNAKYVKGNILDEDGNLIRDVGRADEVYKNYDTRQVAFFLNDLTWNGTKDGEVLPDGNYWYQIEAMIDYEGKDAQTLEVPILLDNTAPSTNIEYIGGEDKLIFNGEDGELGSGIAYYSLIIDRDGDPETPNQRATVYGSELSYTMSEGLTKGAVIIAKAYDNAGNVSALDFHLVEGYDPDIIESVTANPDKFVKISNPTTIKASANQTGNWEVEVMDVNGVVEQLPMATDTNAYEAIYTPWIDAPSGEYKVTAMLKDNTGKLLDKEYVSFYVYNSPLSININSVTMFESDGGEYIESETFDGVGMAKLEAVVENISQAQVANLKLTIQITDQNNQPVHKSFLTANEIYEGNTLKFGSHIPLYQLQPGDYNVEVFVWEEGTQTPYAEKHDVTNFIIQQ
ncbi:S8 family serine peptidase [Longirhabdus pacifica]|uniref:S8 family serine peptidase n=1 Tax=Longirhabdus pacifica TaxID=2305227 RepID=UPI001009361A|nr:S8 family serine peptidase [Longirhabdus pacifica]